MSNCINKIVEYGLYLFVFLLPIQTRWIIRAGEINGGYWEYGTISLYAADILLVLLLALFVIVKFREINSGLKENEGDTSVETRHASSLQTCRFHFLQKYSTLNTMWWLIAGLDLIIFISIFFAPDKATAVFSYFRFLLGVGIFFLIVKASYKILVLLYSFLAGIFFQAGLGIWQFLIQSDFSSRWLGMAVHDSGEPGTIVIETINGSRWLRAYGGLDHPNMLGGLLVVGILLTVGLLIRYNSGIVQKAESKKQIAVYAPLLFIFYFFLFVFTSALFFTFSRGAWAGLIAGFLAMLFLLIIKRDKAGQKKFLIIISGLFILIFLFCSLYGNLVLTRLSVDTRLEAKSLNERVLSGATAGKVIKDRWFIGTGIGNYTNYLNKKHIKDQPAYYYQPVHNAYLLVLAETGFAGLFFFISILFYSLYSGFRKIKNIGFNKGVELSILFVMLAMFMVDHWWWSLHFGIFLFWLCVGLVNKEYTHGD